MPTISKSLYRRFAAILLLSLLFTPIAIFGTGMEDAVEYQADKIRPELSQALSNMKSDSYISIIVEFPDTFSADEMLESIQLAGLESVSIRYAFHLIPMISLSIRVDEINELSKVKDIEEIHLNQKRQLIENSVPQENYVLAENGNGYVHFDSILSADQLWAEGINGTGVTIAVLDSGVWGEHPDLQDRLIGFKDLINGQDDMNPANGIDAYDDNGHGTACAWNAAGDGTASSGVLKGIAPGADILAIKVLDSAGAGEDATIAQGIEFAIEQNVDVISLSLGGEWMESTFLVEASVSEIESAISAGISVAVAAGNSGPAAFTINSPGIAEKAITVGSSYGDSGVVAFSSVGPVLRTRTDPAGYTVKPDIVAPGYLVVSGRGNNVNPIEYPPYNSSQFGSSYTRWSGTSASTPLVAGMIALLMQKHLALAPIEAKAALMNSATDLKVDPMIQGWGLANVSRASQLLNSTSRDITVMAPRSIPTLPWSKQVLIVGDDRPPQNVTIISTQSVGIVDISISGNASLFLDTNIDQIWVPTGYSYFGIELKLPENTPLSSAGVYAGQLNLTQSSNVIASIDIRYSITIFGGRLMVDMEHHSSGPSGDVDDPSYYGYFTEYLREQGMVVSEFGDAEDLSRSYIDLNTISSADVFMIMDTEISYYQSEVTALHTFVENGGTLLVFSEFYNQVTDEASFAFDDYNAILEPFGIQCEKRTIGAGIDNTGIVYGADHGGFVENDPLMNGVSNLYVLQGSTLQVNPEVSNARGLFWEDAERTHAIVATAEYGRGHVFVISDGSTLYDDVLYDAINAGADNLRLLRNLATAIIPEAPRIYDVDLSVGGFGQEANVTAFIFDEDLEDVTISVIGPRGENLTGTIIEELGYKFSTNFIFNGGGFFSVQVRATDSLGNVRLFQKTILIPVDAADDLVIVSVIYALLGVVGIGLGYVILIRVRSRPKRPQRPIEPRQDEDEWELPPPSIE